MQWMDDVVRLMNTSEKPRDVSGVELLMNNHQSLKAEIDAREDTFTACINLGKELLARDHYARTEILDKLVALKDHRKSVNNRWEERWENLQLSKFLFYFIFFFFCRILTHTTIFSILKNQSFSEFNDV